MNKLLGLPLCNEGINQIQVPYRDVISDRDWPEVAKDLEGHRCFNAYTLWL